MGVVTRLGVASCTVIVNKYIRNSLIFEVDLVQRNSLIFEADLVQHVPKKTPSLHVVECQKANKTTLTFEFR
jgi:hypothetical protein